VDSSVFFFRASVAFVFSAALIASTALATPVHRTTAGSGAHSSHHKAKSHKLHGQQAIEPARVTEIQQALIREHYLTGEASGKWDATTEAAMQKYQADQGWQTKLMPDSRALKKLGLGPDYSNAINAKDSSFGEPPPASSIPPVQAAGFADAAKVTH
jgi:peptidoglycan hydrolase-like protein with peptidoglycan-binding domain